jgi:hypothetical protein
MRRLSANSGPFKFSDRTANDRSYFRHGVVLAKVKNCL